MTSDETINIVRLDGWVCPPPHFSPSFSSLSTSTYTNHLRTEPTTDVICERLKDMDVAITTRIPITREILAREESKRLKLVAVLAIGTDMVDLEACKERGVEVRNVPAASIEAVAEHALGLFFALRRNTVGLHNLVAGSDEWVEKGNLTSHFGGLPGTCKEEVVGIIGAGELGTRIATLCRALGMTVHLSEQKSTPSSSVRPNRLPFAETLSTCTTIFLTLPLTPTTTNLISTPELATMRPDALIVNVARGGIIDEEAVIQELKKGTIKGFASDVFFEEPAGGHNSVLVRAVREAEEEKGVIAEGEVDLRGRVVLSPHVAWFARSSIEKLRRVVGENIESWARGEEMNLVTS
ncbi:D-isomer specific 2-hydroxyacid dehydrogenase [Tricladium varicosporioides]|nr:D-isomer specific 2-hydroxyacid dehydrogenase [Hymenoscyphus varicosporioides]